MKCFMHEAKSVSQNIGKRSLGGTHSVGVGCLLLWEWTRRRDTALASQGRRLHRAEMSPLRQPPCLCLDTELQQHSRLTKSSINYSVIIIFILYQLNL